MQYPTRGNDFNSHAIRDALLERERTKFAVHYFAVIGNRLHIFMKQLVEKFVGEFAVESKTSAHKTVG